VAVCFAGLSYSTFAYSDLKVTPGAISATITNNGSVAGSEAAQLYLGYPAEAGEPPKVLRGISKVSLQAGAKATVRAHRLYLCTPHRHHPASDRQFSSLSLSLSLSLTHTHTYQHSMILYNILILCINIIIISLFLCLYTGNSLCRALLITTSQSSSGTMGMAAMLTRRVRWVRAIVGELSARRSIDVNLGRR
jgi:hypothetical protein